MWSAAAGFAYVDAFGVSPPRLSSLSALSTGVAGTSPAPPPIRDSNAIENQLSTKIQPSSGPSPVYSLIAHNQADPRACYIWIGQVDILTDQSFCAVALRIDEPTAGSVVPVEQEVDAFARDSRFGMALLPFILGVSWDRGVGAAIPAAGPISFDGTVLVLTGRCAPDAGIFVVRRSLQFDIGREVHDLLVVRIGYIRDAKRVASSATFISSVISMSFGFRFHPMISELTC